MKVLIITGSPHQQGTSALLADRFADGALSKGHTVERFDAALEQVNPCHACAHCKANDGKCIQNDSMQKLYPLLADADVIVLATPLYFMGMTAQLKAVVDRFFAMGAKLTSKPKKAFVLTAFSSDAVATANAFKMQYTNICAHLKWNLAGEVLAYGVPDRKSVEATDFPKQAYDLGASL